MNLSLLFIAHLTGDFILQNHWMQAKVRNSFVCLVHVLIYSALFWLLLPWPWVIAILIQHYLQDRYSLHRKWMTLYRHTTPDIWPVGPICVDQAFHLLFITLVYLSYVATPIDFIYQTD